MFDFLSDKTISLMLRLSAENRSVSKEDLASVDMRKLYDICFEHELHGVVASHIIEDDLATLPDYWRSSYEKERERLEFLKRKSHEMCSAMREAGITMVILKNGGIMTDIVPDAAACPMEDIDSLVKKNDFFKAHDILISNGFIFKFRSEFEREILDEAYRDGSSEYYIIMPDGEKMWFELSWRAVAGRWIRPDKEPLTDELVARSYFSEGTDVGILSPEDNLLQVCIHTAKHSYVRSPGLRLHLDVDRIVSNKEIDWAAFVKRVKETRVKTSVYYSLMIPKQLFGTDVPSGVLEALKPSPRRARIIEKLLSGAGLLHPNERKFSKLEFLRFQVSLYDAPKDALRVIYPSYAWYKERYGMKCPLQLPYYVVLRVLDLVGIRKKK